MVFANFIISIRYIFIFKLKNPAAFHDDFWSLFLNIWIVSFALIVTLSFEFVYESYPYHLQLCTGVIPKSPSENARFSPYLSIFTVLLHIVLMTKIQMYKYTTTSNTSRSTKSKIDWLLFLDNQSLNDLTTNLILSIILLFLAFSPALITNVTKVTDFNLYPHYLVEYFYRLGRPPITFMIVILIYYTRHTKLRHTVFREFCQLVNWELL